MNFFKSKINCFFLFPHPISHFKNIKCSLLSTKRRRDGPIKIYTVIIRKTSFIDLAMPVYLSHSFWDIPTKVGTYIDVCGRLCISYGPLTHDLFRYEILLQKPVKKSSKRVRCCFLPTDEYIQIIDTENHRKRKTSSHSPSHQIFQI